MFILIDMAKNPLENFEAIPWKRSWDIEFTRKGFGRTDGRTRKHNRRRRGIKKERSEPPSPRYPHFHVKMSCVAITFMPLCTLWQHCALWEEVVSRGEPPTGLRGNKFHICTHLLQFGPSPFWRPHASWVLQWNSASVTNQRVSAVALVCWEI